MATRNKKEADGASERSIEGSLVRYVGGEAIGRVVRAGPEQSEVKWPTGQTQAVSNDHIEILEADPEEGFPPGSPVEYKGHWHRREQTMATSANAAKKAAPKKTAPKKAATKSAPAARKAAVTGRPAKSDGSAARTRLRDEQVIRLKGDNPRREGTDAHKHFEKMKGGITVGAYLKKFPEADRRTARQWLSNTIKSGHATLAG